MLLSGSYDKANNKLKYYQFESDIEAFSTDFEAERSMKGMSSTLLHSVEQEKTAAPNNCDNCLETKGI